MEVVSFCLANADGSQMLLALKNKNFVFLLDRVKGKFVKQISNPKKDLKPVSIKPLQLNDRTVFIVRDSLWISVLQDPQIGRLNHLFESPFLGEIPQGIYNFELHVDTNQGE